MNKIPKGYKQTEVGIIPEEWDVKKIKFVAPLQRGFDLPTSQLNEGIYPVVYSNGIGNYHNSFMAKAPGVVTGRSGTLGKVSFIIKDYWPHNTSLWVTKFFENFPLFIYYLLIRINLEKFGTGSGVPTLNRNDVHDFKVPIPPFEEQSAIAEALSDVDALISSLDELIAKKRNIKQGAMQELLTGKRRLPGFSGKWETKKLGDLLAYEQPTKYLVKDTEYNDNNDIPVLTAGKTFILGYTNEQAGIFNNVPVIIFDDFTMANKYIVFSFKAKSSAMKMLKPKDINVNLRFVFEKMQLIELPLGDHKRYWISEYQNLEIEIPKQEEQSAIASVLSDMDAEIEQLERKRDKYKQVKQGMMQELLTGKTRLI